MMNEKSKLKKTLEYSKSLGYTYTTIEEIQEGVRKRNEGYYNSSSMNVLVDFYHTL